MIEFTISVPDGNENTTADRWKYIHDDLTAVSTAAVVMQDNEPVLNLRDKTWRVVVRDKSDANRVKNDILVGHYGLRIEREVLFPDNPILVWIVCLVVNIFLAFALVRFLGVDPGLFAWVGLFCVGLKYFMHRLVEGTFAWIVVFSGQIVFTLGWVVLVGLPKFGQVFQN